MRRGIFARVRAFHKCQLALATFSLALVVGGKAQGVSADLAAVVAGNNQFAFDLYDALGAGGDGSQNLFFSPMSVSTALAMTYAGARGQTAQEMEQVLHFGLPPDALHAAFGELLTDLASPQRQDYELNIANRLWGQGGFPFHQSYLDLTRDRYGAELGLVDFIQDTENSRLSINEWVEDQTNDRIQELLPAGSVTQDTRLVLTNAIYFLGDWKKQFRASDTHTGVFHVSPAEQLDVAMMNQTSSFRYGELPEAQVLEMPYEGDDVSMLLMLPREQNGLAALDDWLTPDSFDEAVESLDWHRVDVSLPKFTIESDVPLKSVLQQMGMVNAFSDFADFTGMADANLAISDVVHKAFVRVDEKGTEAAAATGVIVGVTSVPPPPDAYFRADHPFLLALRDNRTESVLFLGRVMRPETPDDGRDQAALGGDFNGDGNVDQGDLDLVLLDWGADASAVGSLDGWRIGRADGMIDQGELDAVLLGWGNSSPSLQAAGVPEPAAWVLAITSIGALAGLAKAPVSNRKVRVGLDMRKRHF